MTDEHDRYLKFLADGDPLVVIILKGHLVLETLLDDILSKLTDRGDLLVQAANSFHRKKLIAQAHSGSRSGDTAWELIRLTNTLRNEIAHNLDPTKSAGLISNLRQILTVRDPVSISLIPDPKSDVQMVSHAISFLIGFLQGYRREVIS